MPRSSSACVMNLPPPCTSTGRMPTWLMNATPSSTFSNSSSSIELPPYLTTTTASWKERIYGRASISTDAFRIASSICPARRRSAKAEGGIIAPPGAESRAEKVGREAGETRTDNLPSPCGKAIRPRSFIARSRQAHRREYCGAGSANSDDTPVSALGRCGRCPRFPSFPGRARSRA